MLDGPILHGEGFQFSHISGMHGNNCEETRRLSPAPRIQFPSLTVVCPDKHILMPNYG